MPPKRSQKHSCQLSDELKALRICIYPITIDGTLIDVTLIDVTLVDVIRPREPRIEPK